MSTPFDERHDPFAEAPGRWSSIWKWLPPIIGLIVFEWTLDPMLGAIFACLRFGERDFSTAIWLLRNDANRPRAWSCSSAHACRGLAWIGVVGLGMGILAAMLIPSLVRFLPPVMMRQGMGISLATCAVVPLFSMASVVMMATAMAGRVKVWASPTNSRARREGVWPPIPDHAVNWASNSVQTIVIFGFLLTPLSLFVPWAIHGRPPVGNPGPLNPLQLLALMISPLALLAYLRLAAWVAVHIAAREPQQCWPEVCPDTLDEDS
ncbi:hypothetical protein P12x_002141 [Tundrisphaera lichenicola]|uniref:hypothetical protein n=1 Tax=Tundrisphaera lichenicola TaxID=2029860 RepID=UPI003EB91760